jgi:hypothetical protein
MVNNDVYHIILNKDEIGDDCPRTVAAFVTGYTTALQALLMTTSSA